MDEDWDDNSSQPTYQAQSSNSYQQGGYEQRNDNNFRQPSDNRRNDGRYNNRDRSRGSNRGDRNGRREQDYNRNSNEEGGEQTTFFVETSKLGKLIGKGGSKIRELEGQTGAKIKINKDCVNGDSTLVIVSGAKDSQDQVRTLIDELLSDQRPNRPFTMNTMNSEESNNSDNVQRRTSSIDWDEAAKEHDQYQAQKWEKYGSIKKNFYIEDPEVASLSKSQVEKIRKDNNEISVDHTFHIDPSQADSEEYRIPNPIQTFEQAFKSYPDILVEIRKQNFEKPSPIQCQAWPVLLSGKDMIGIAQTGTGKTLAFLLPALIHIDNQDTPRSERSGPTVLVMAPTRELALQIEKEVNKYYYHGIKAVCVYGGGDRKKQMSTVSKGVEIVIATPGRLNDLIQTEVLDVKCVSYLVLDEADRMLDMGFEPQIRKSLLDIRPDRQTVMTSATWPPGVRRLAESYMKNPITVCVGSLDLKAVHSVTQKIWIVQEEEKTDVLKEFFHNMGPTDKVIVFFGKKCKVDDIGSDLALSGVACQSIHGGREQADREQALEDIKKGDVNILLATDVASRGIDIEDITHVFNYDFPKDIEEYVHRVGRTGRAGKTGESISLFTRRDWGQATELIKILEEAEQEIPTELYGMAERYEANKKKRDEERGDGDRRDSGGRRYGGGGGGFGGGGGGGRFGGGGGGFGGGGFGGGGGGRRGGSRW